MHTITGVHAHTAFILDAEKAGDKVFLADVQASSLLVPMPLGPSFPRSTLAGVGTSFDWGGGGGGGGGQHYHLQSKYKKNSAIRAIHNTSSYVKITKVGGE